MSNLTKVYINYSDLNEDNPFSAISSLEEKSLGNDRLSLSFHVRNMVIEIFLDGISYETNIENSIKRTIREIDEHLIGKSKSYKFEYINLKICNHSNSAGTLHFINSNYRVVIFNVDREIVDTLLLKLKSTLTSTL